VAVTVVVIASCAGLDLACISSSPTPVTFDYDGLQRLYYVHRSALDDGTADIPLVLVLHGMGQTGNEMIDWTGMNTVSDAMGFNVIYPNAYEENWNDGRAVPGIAAYDQDVDDVGFLDAIIERVKGDLHVDTNRVYVAGMSNGALMAYRLACEVPERYAAIATVAGAMPTNVAEYCSSAAPLPLIAFNGTYDGIVPWNGGALVVDGEDLGDILSVPETIALCVDNNHCSPAAQIVTMPDASPSDGTRVYQETYAPQLGGADVVFYRIEGGGHTWPGGPAIQFLLGTVCYDIDASELIAEFCLEHTR